MTVKDLWGLVKAAASGWVDDYAQSMGAALAYYTMFSIAPLLLIVISTAGLVFGEQAARGEIFSQLEDMLGAPGALAVQGLLESVRKPTESVDGHGLRRRPAADWRDLRLCRAAGCSRSHLACAGQGGAIRILEIDPGAIAVLRPDSRNRVPVDGVVGGERRVGRTQEVVEPDVR